MTYSSPVLSRHGAVAGAGVDAGVAWHYGDPTAEQRALERGGAFVDLSHHGVVTVSGPDRLGWLNSITSQLLLDLGPRDSTETLVLSPHGHVEHALVASSTTARRPGCSPSGRRPPSWPPGSSA